MKSSVLLFAVPFVLFIAWMAYLGWLVAGRPLQAPGYPLVVSAVFDYFARHPQMRLLCIVDREDIVAAAKFLICRRDALAMYEQDLLSTFSRFRYILNADMESYEALVLTPHPRVADLS